MAVSNVNKINQSNNFNTRLTRPKIERDYSALQIGQTTQSTGDMGILYPVFMHEMIPGEKVTLSQDAALQFMPFVSNLFHEIEGAIYNYFVPYRLLWDKWEDFITGGKDGMNNDIPPRIQLYPFAGGKKDGFKNLLGTLADYFGLPLSVMNDNEDAVSAGIDEETLQSKAPQDSGLDLSDEENASVLAFPFRAYNLIWNEHIRIPDIEDEREQDNIFLARGHWAWDYFTRGRIYQQRGVIPTVPINDVGQVLNHEFQYGYWTGRPENQSMEWHQEDSNGIFSGNTVGDNNGSPISPVADEYITIFKQAGDTLRNDNIDHGTGKSNNIRLMPHDLEQLGINMNDFLIALGIMRYQVNNAKIETRYGDHLRIRWGVYPEDARLQMPEYLGSSTFPIVIDTVTQTSEGTTTKQGNITGQAYGTSKGSKTHYSAKEHGIIMSLMIIRPKTVYEQGISKYWTKKSRFDFPTPELANLPDVEIKQKELFLGANISDNERTFGWQGIYEEYRTSINFVTGYLRPSIKGGLGHYTLARFWGSAGGVIGEANQPRLNKEFIECRPDKKRILQYPEEPTFIYFVRNDLKTAIPLPIQSEPAELGNL